MDPSVEKCRQILSVSKRASLREVKEAYLDLAKVWHPDRFAGNPRLEKKATEKLKEINAAYAILVAFHENAESLSGSEDVSGDVEVATPEGPVETDDPELKKPKHSRLFFAMVILCVAAVLGGGIYLSMVLKNKGSHVPVVIRPLPQPQAETGATAREKTSPEPSRTQKSTASPKGAPDRKPSAPQKFFTLGSSKDEVLAVEGAPYQTSDNRWNYGSSYVEFAKGRVTGWLNSALDPLQVKMQSRKGAEEASFTLGSPKDEVAAVQGAPTQVSGNRWSYGFSRVDFRKGRVAGWYNSTLDPLRVKMTTEATPDRKFFTLGSTKSEVLAAQGTPTRLSEDRWGYGYSYVDFENGKVARWYNSEQDPLLIEVEP